MGKKRSEESNGVNTHKKLVSLGNFLFLWTFAGEGKLAGRQKSRFIFYSCRSHALFLLY